jgi:hypothetical protein
MLKTGEADIAYALAAPTPGTSKAPGPGSCRQARLIFGSNSDQWDPNRRGDQRVRLAANYALDRQMT